MPCTATPTNCNRHSVIHQLSGLGGNWGVGYVAAQGGMAVLSVCQIHVDSGTVVHDALPAWLKPAVVGTDRANVTAYGYLYNAGDATSQGQIAVIDDGRWITYLNKASDYAVGQVIYPLEQGI